ncbi:MAG: di/tricarboxylate transporter [Planctomycetota bacterium]|jgi:di/tricarboxylate transporter
MTFDSWITVAVLAFCLFALVRTRWPVDAVLIGSVSLLMFLGVLTPEQALAGMSNPGMITVGVLYVVVSGLERAGMVAWISGGILVPPRRPWLAKLRMMGSVAGLSSVLNNTPVVAMLIPAVTDWCKRHEISVSQLMIPLSYAAIVGGLCTLVGTSTNLVINGMMLSSGIGGGLSMFELTWIGLPCIVVTLVYVLIFGPRLLPHRLGTHARFEDARQYIVEMELEADSPLAGQSIEEAGLRHLPSVYLVEIERDGHLMTVVSPREELKAGDRLVFAGDVESVVDLQKIRGLRPAETQVFKLDMERAQRCLVEVVISSNFPGLRQSVRDMGFRHRYGAAIIAASRQGKNIRGRIGDIRLRPGDTLLLEAPPEFERQQQFSKDFLLVSAVANSQPLRHEKRYLAGIILVGMVLLVGVGVLSMFKAVMLAAGLMLVTRCTTVHVARQSVDWQVLLVIAASIGLGTAVETSGAAGVIAGGLIEWIGQSPLAALVVLFTVTSAFSAVISNIAAAVLVFPIAAATSTQLGVAFEPYAITLMVAASASFATPIGYQTNLMVYGPGDYRFSDFLRMGLPLTVLIGLTTALIVPAVWPF